MINYFNYNVKFIKSFSFDENIENKLIQKVPNFRLKTKDIIHNVIFLLNDSFENKLKLFIKKNTNNVSRQFKEIYHYFNNEFDELFNKIGIDKNKSDCFRKLVLFLNGKLNKCKFCGKITEREYCSRICSNSNHSDESIKLQRNNSIKTMIEKYGSNYSSTQLFKEKIKLISKEKYINGHKPECFKNFKDLNKEFILNNFIINNKFNSDKMKEYFDCSISFINKFKIKNNIKIENKRIFSKSKIQEKLFNWIPTNNKISNTRQLIKPLEIDIYLPDIKLAIEYNGSYWHSKKDKNYHLNKTNLCNKKGIQLFHIFDFDNLDIWKSIINNKLKLNNKIYARKCIIKELNNDEIFDFLNNNHLNGYEYSDINLGLFYNNELIELMTFKKLNNYYELIRLCSKKYNTIIGGVSKLFNYFINNYLNNSFNNIITYIDKRYSNGNIFKQLGFIEKSIIKPQLFEYFNVYDCGKILYEFSKM